MAYAATPGTPRARPSTVNTAVILLYVTALLQLVNAIAAAANYNGFKEAYTNTYAGTSLEGQENSAAVGAVAGSIVVGVLLALVFAILAIFDGRGSNVARIITWIFSALAVCCLALNLVGAVAGETLYKMAAQNQSDLPPYSEVQQNLESSLPGWYGPLTLVAGIGSLLAVIIAAILLALPSSNPFFRKPAPPAWEPPLPGQPPLR